MSDSAATISTSTGLSAQEAQRRLRADGPNELPSQKPRTLLAILREVLTEPMFLLLIAAAGVYLVLGDRTGALVLASSIVVIIAITALQERRTEHALSALRDLSSPRALVIRDGVQQRIPGKDVVVGDLVLLREGDRVPADGLVRSATALSVDESILTGESLPAEKIAYAGDDAHEAARVYSGTLIVHGFGTAEILATGARSEIGKIGSALATLETETTPLFRETRTIVRWIAIAAVTLCVLVALLYSLARNDWLGGTLAGITLAMSVLPEEFPVVLTVFLAMGAWRTSRAGVLTRRMPAIEAIGAATILAVDKTGTLTENRMRVVSHSPDVLSIAFAACERDAFDPMERAIQEAARERVPAEVARFDEMELVREYDMTPELPAVTHVWRRPGSAQVEVAVKGAPETVADLCRIDDQAREALLREVAEQANTGLRILAVASGTHDFTALPDTPRDFRLELLGSIALADPLRRDVPQALEECAEAGIRVAMITGDHPGTALAIASAAGFDTDGGMLTGAELESMTDESLQQRARSVNVFARTRPEHKLRLIRAFKAAGDIVAMTGDGVNDAPALRAAHIGVAMGERGTDVAREAAALVLVNDDFSSLVTAVRLGRRIYSNIRHAMTYIIAVHIPLAALGLLPVLFGWPLLFFPLHVLFLEFVIDPACAFVFEADAEAADIMKRKPRPPDERLFTGAMLSRSIALGLLASAICVSVYGLALRSLSEPQARALGFTALVISNLTLIFVSRARSESLATVFFKANRVYWLIAALALAALAVTIGIPSVATLFKFAAPPSFAVLLVTVATLSAVTIGGSLLRPRQ